MNLADSYGRYKRMQVETADQGTLILMLYDGAILALKHSHQLLNTKPLDREKFSNQIVKARNIIYELAASLNLEAGGEIAKSLLSLYDYFVWRIGQADIKKDPIYLEDVLKHLQELRGAWATIFRNARIQPKTDLSTPVSQPALRSSRISSIVA